MHDTKAALDKIIRQVCSAGKIVCNATYEGHEVRGGTGLGAFQGACKQITLGSLLESKSISWFLTEALVAVIDLEGCGPSQPRGRNIFPIGFGGAEGPDALQGRD